MTRMAKPGPGNGCLLTRSRGIPNCTPSSRTSSLWKSRRGSMTLPYTRKYKQRSELNVNMKGARGLRRAELVIKYRMTNGRGWWSF